MELPLSFDILLPNVNTTFLRRRRGKKASFFWLRFPRFKFYFSSRLITSVFILYKMNSDTQFQSPFEMSNTQDRNVHAIFQGRNNSILDPRLNTKDRHFVYLPRGYLDLAALEFQRSARRSCDYEAAKLQDFPFNDVRAQNSLVKRIFDAFFDTSDAKVGQIPENSREFKRMRDVEDGDFLIASWRLLVRL